MKLNTILSLLLFGILAACGNTTSKDNVEYKAETQINEESEENSHALNVVEISTSQFDALNIKLGTVKKRNMAGTFTANGQLEVPPQNEASVTTVYGATIKSINVIEGQQVKKGQVLAYIAHPDK